MKKHQAITLRAWIERQGVAFVAHGMNVTRQTVNNWRRGHCTPQSHQAQRLRDLSKGELDYAAIIENRRAAK